MACLCELYEKKPGPRDATRTIAGAQPMAPRHLRHAEAARKTLLHNAGLVLAHASGVTEVRRIELITGAGPSPACERTAAASSGGEIAGYLTWSSFLARRMATRVRNRSAARELDRQIDLPVLNRGAGAVVVIGPARSETEQTAGSAPLHRRGQGGQFASRRLLSLRSFALCISSSTSASRRPIRSREGASSRAAGKPSSASVR